MEGGEMRDIEGLKAASERVLASLEAGRPKPTRNALRALLLAWNLNHYSYQAWMRAHAPEHLLRWSRLRGLWAEAFHGYIAQHRDTMSTYAIAAELGVSPSLVQNAIAAERQKKVAKQRLQDARKRLKRAQAAGEDVDLPSLRQRGTCRPDKARELGDDEADALEWFVETIYSQTKRKIPDPVWAYQRLSNRLRRLKMQRYEVQLLLKLHRPDVYVLYHELKRKRAANLLRIGLSEGYRAMAIAADISDITARGVMRQVRQGKPWHGVALRDGELVSVEMHRGRGKPHGDDAEAGSAA